MKKLKYISSISGLMLGVFAASEGQAQTTIDVAKITCQQLTLMKVADPDYIAIWLSGYYNGKRNSTVVDVEGLKDHAKKVKSYCLYNDKGTVMEAVQKLLGNEK